MYHQQPCQLDVQLSKYIKVLCVAVHIKSLSNSWLSHYTAAVHTLCSASSARLFAMAIWFSMSCICTARHHKNYSYRQCLTAPSDW